MNENSKSRAGDQKPAIKKKIKNRSPRRDDELWKGVLEDVFDDFLRFFFPDADELFNMKKKFVFLDKEFNRLFPPEKNTAGVRFVDKLVKVHLKAGGSKFILVHIEVQGQKGKEDLSARMFRYFYRAKDKHNVSITAFAILIDDVKNHRPGAYEEAYLGTKLIYEFNTYKLLDQDETKLRADPNPFAVVTLTVLLALKNKNIGDMDLKQIKLDLTRELIKRSVNKVKYIKIMDFLTYYVNFENPETMRKFEEEVQQLTGRTTTMGVREILQERWKNEALEQGIEQGRELGIELGREQGIEQGIEQGLEQGIRQGAQLERTKAIQEKREIARTLKKLGVSMANIAESTGFPIEEVKTL